MNLLHFDELDDVAALGVLLDHVDRSPLMTVPGRGDHASFDRGQIAVIRATLALLLRGGEVRAAP